MTRRTIRWTKRALRRLGEIGAYIEKDNPLAAARTVSRIVFAVESLAEQPGMGRAGRIRGTRELVLADISYIIPYRVHVGQIDILTVLHATQKWPETF